MPPEHDHKLQWDLFRLSELSCYDAMMSRLYKLELEALVMKYEACRSVAWRRRAVGSARRRRLWRAGLPERTRRVSVNP